MASQKHFDRRDFLKRTGSLTAGAALAGKAASEKFFAEEGAADVWELWLAAAKTSWVIDQCVATAEPAYAAKHAFQLAQQFNNFYHRHHILSEANADRRAWLLATAAMVQRELVAVLATLGIETPSVM